MQYFDEQFARMEHEIRKSEKLRLRKEQAKLDAETAKDTDADMEDASKTPEQKNLPTQEEIDAAVAANLFQINEDDTGIAFARTSFFDDRISMKFPKDYFELKNDSNGYLVYMNINAGVHCVLNFYEGDGAIDTQKIKNELLDTYKKSKIRTSWNEEGKKRINGKPMSYFVFVIHTARMDYFNYMCIMAARGGFLTINFNGENSEFALWEMLVKSMFNTIEIMA